MRAISNHLTALPCFHLRRVLTLSFFLLSTSATGQPTPAPLGTLFFSSSERSAIVGARSGETPSATSSNGVASVGSSVTVNGLVKRSGQKSTVWINKQSMTEGQGIPDVGIPVIGAKSVMINGQPVRVRETLDLESRARSDALPQGSVSAGRQK